MFRIAPSLSPDRRRHHFRRFNRRAVHRNLRQQLRRLDQLQRRAASTGFRRRPERLRLRLGTYNLQNASGFFPPVVLRRDGSDASGDALVGGSFASSASRSTSAMTSI